VERSPPPLFAQDFSSACPSITTDTSGANRAAWVQANVATAGSPSRTEEWNCGAFGPDDRSVLFEGVNVTKSTCVPSPCQPFSLLGGLDHAQIMTPAFQVPDVDQPYLFLEHQYSTQSWIIDQSGPTSDGFAELGSSGATAQNRAMLVASRGKVLVQVQEGPTTWGTPLVVDPDIVAGALAPYTSERQVGIQDPRYGLAGRPSYLGGKDVCVDAIHEDSLDSLKGCGFWWPTGFQPLYRPAGDNITTGATFSGSPWLVDRFPLFGHHLQGYVFTQNTPTHHGTATAKSLDTLAGRTVRLVFDFDRSAAPAANDPFPSPVRDYGWRIGGLSVVEGGNHLQRDLSLEDLRIDAPLYDPATMGVANGTTVPVILRVRNNGLADVTHLTANLTGLNTLGGATAPLCWKQTELDITIPHGEMANLTLPCTLKPDIGPALLLLGGWVMPEGGDDLPADNQRTLREPLLVQQSPDIGVQVAVSPPGAAPGSTPRDIQIRVENHGNLNLTGFTVHAHIKKAGDGPDLVPTQTWTVAGVLPVGQSLLIHDHALDILTDAPGGLAPATYVAKVDVFHPGDLHPGNDLASASFNTMDALYHNDFTHTAQSTPAVCPSPCSLPPLQDPWKVTTGGEKDGNRLVAGAEGQVPTNTSATVELPPLDLTTVKGASLTMRHRYDLEASFDAGRVEISTDNGTTWRTLRPVPDPLGGLPEGYPSIPLLGNTSFLDGSPKRQAAAFTGQSANLPTSGDGGWMSSAFDLASDPGLRRTSAIDAFNLDGFASKPSIRLAAKDGTTQFTDPLWVLLETNAQANQRYWSVENSTYDIVPHSGQQMWWSHSAGKEATTAVANALQSRSIPLARSRSNDALNLTWWDWRAGAGDGDPATRQGTGGDFAVRLSNAVKTVTRTPRVVAVEPSGWTKREIDVTDFVDSSDPSVKVTFSYSSAYTPVDTRAFAQTNLGWFIDDVAVVSLQTVAGKAARFNPVTVYGDNMDGPTTEWDASQHPSGPAWSLVNAGSHVAASDGGWHVATQQVVPGLSSSANVWRFGDAQGYPSGADSRLVTPVVDLSGFGAQTAHLDFFQQYGFEARTKCPHLPTSCANQPGSFLSAIDGGAVEFQVYNTTTGSFDPWRQLGARFTTFPDSLLFDAKSTPATFTDSTGQQVLCTEPPNAGQTDQEACWTRSGDSLTDVWEGAVRNRELLAATGYPAVEEHGSVAQATHNALVEGHPDINVVQQPASAGHGTTFETHPGQVFWQWNFKYSDGGGGFQTARRPYGWHPYPVSYVFSGQSNGWHPVDWDITPLVGHQVRFGFHAATNPSVNTTTVAPYYNGWGIAGVSVVGDVFQGQKAKIRLHVATDGSLSRDEWSVDDVALTGERFTNEIAVVPDTPLAVQAIPGTPLELHGHVANLGNSAQHDYLGGLRLALAVKATGIDGSQVTLSADNRTLPAADPASIPGLTEGLASFDLAAAGAVGNSTLPFTLTLPNPPAGPIQLRVVVLQNLPPTFTQVHGAGGDVSLYETPHNDVGGSNVAVWNVEGKSVLDLQPASPVPGRDPPVVATPLSDGLVHLEAAVRNNGTQTPTLAVQWSFKHITQKGGGADQPNTQELPTGDGQTTSKDALLGGAMLKRGDTAVARHDFGTPQSGLYRATARFFANGGSTPAKTLQFEFLVGQSSQYYSVDFGKTSGLAGWTLPPSPGVTSPQVETPAQIGFRRSGPDLLWGVNASQLLRDAPEGYCSFGGCNYDVSTTGNERVQGLEGAADSPAVIDLTRVPQGSAILAVDGLLSFTDGDGAQVEAIPYSRDGDGALTPAFPACPDGSARTFLVKPVSAADYGGAAYSQNVSSGAIVESLIHPLSPDPDASPAPILGGIQESRRVGYFSLGGAVTSTCHNGWGASVDAMQTHLVNYTVGLRLHVGTRPGLVGDAGERTGQLGWAVRAVSVSSTAVQVLPSGQTYPVQPGAPKDFAMQVHNVGQAMDSFSLAFQSDSPDFQEGWVSFPAPSVSLAPGESRTIPFRVDIPGEAQLSPAAYATRIVVRSLTSPSVSTALEASMEVAPNLLPDLVVLTPLASDPSGTVFQAGTDAHIFATIRNLGTLDSLPVHVQLLAADTSKPLVEPTLVETTDLPCLHPAASTDDKTCKDAVATVQLEWVVPQAVGNVTLTVVADPAGSPELRRDNNQAVLHATVVPLAVPDMAVTSLLVDGVSRDGSTEAGASITVRANVTNLGFAPAHRVHVRIYSDSTPLLDNTTEMIAAGQTLPFSTTFQASAGEFILKAAVPATGQDLNPFNNELSRKIRVRVHDLGLHADSTSLAVDPGQILTTVVTVENRGNSVEHVLLSGNTTLSGWGFALSPNPVTVAPHDSALAVLSLLAPTDAPAGINPVTLQAIPAGNPAAAASLLLNVTVSPRGGTPTVWAGPLSAPPGLVRVPVALASHNNIAQNVTLALVSPAWNSTVAHVVLAPGANQSVPVDIQVPAATPVGPYTLVFKATVFPPEVAPPFRPALKAPPHGAGKTFFCQVNLGDPSLATDDGYYFQDAATAGTTLLANAVRLRAVGSNGPGTLVKANETAEVGKTCRAVPIPVTFGAATAKGDLFAQSFGSSSGYAAGSCVYYHNSATSGLQALDLRLTNCTAGTTAYGAGSLVQSGDQDKANAPAAIALGTGAAFKFWDSKPNGILDGGDLLYVSSTPLATAAIPSLNDVRILGGAFGTKVTASDVANQTPPPPAAPTVVQAATSLRVLSGTSLTAAWQGGTRVASGQPGVARLVLNLGLNNTGNVPVNVSATPHDLGNGLSAATQHATQALPPGGTAVLPFPVDVAGDAPSSLYGLVDVWVSQADGHGNATLAATLKLPAVLDAADLHIKRVDITPRSQVSAGDLVHVTVVVENQGTQDAPATRLGAFVNGDLLDDPEVPALPAGHQAVVNINLTFDRAGNYLILLQADGENRIQEMEKDNNGVSQALTVSPPPPLSKAFLHEKAPAAGIGLVAVLMLGAALVRRRRGGIP
jgi:hypothetical protein